MGAAECMGVLWKLVGTRQGLQQLLLHVRSAPRLPFLLCFVMLELDPVNISFCQPVPMPISANRGHWRMLPGDGMKSRFSGFRPPSGWELPSGTHLSSHWRPTPWRCPPHPAATLRPASATLSDIARGSKISLPLLFSAL